MRKISDFAPVLESDVPGLKDKAVLDIVAPIHKSLKDLTQMAQGQTGMDNLNEELLQVDLVPGTWNTIELHKIKGGPPLGAWPILVDNAGGSLYAWGCELIDEKHIRVKISLLDSTGTPITTGSHTVRIWVKGS